MNPARLTVVPRPDGAMEVALSSLMCHGRGSIHLHRAADGHFNLRVDEGAGLVMFDKAAAVQLWTDLNAELLLDEAEGHVQPGDYLDQVTPSTADFLREDAARDAAWDEGRT